MNVVLFYRPISFNVFKFKQKLLTGYLLESFLRNAMFINHLKKPLSFSIPTPLNDPMRKILFPAFLKPQISQNSFL